MSSQSYIPMTFASIRRTPSFGIQSDWELVLREFNQGRTNGTGVHSIPKESTQFWTSLDGLPDGEDINVTVKLEERKQDPSTGASSASSSSLTAAARSVAINSNQIFEMEFLGPLQLVAHHTNTKTTCLFQAARSQWKLHPQGEIFSVDVNHTGTIGISSGEQGSVRLWDANSGTLIRSLLGHKGDVHLARFFPSGSVALTTGLDLVVRIWACDSGLEATHLPGHSRPITSVNFLDRGRNLITSGEDGETRLWDVSTQQTVAKYPTQKDAFAPKINDAIVFEPDQHPLSFSAPNNSASSSSAVPSSTSGSLLLTGSSDGLIRGYDLRVGHQVFLLPTGLKGGIESLAKGPMEFAFTLGSGEGVISVVELRKKIPLYSMQQDDAAITSIRPWSEDGIWTTNSTGSTNLWQLSGSSSSVVAQLTGVDCDTIHDSCFAQNYAYIAAHDVIRVYSLSALQQKTGEERFHGLEIPTRRAATTSTATPAAAK